MIDTPEVTETKAQHLAKLHLKVAHSEMQKVMWPGVQEVLAAVAAQGMKPAGPWFTHHLRIGAEGFDFEICIPVPKPFTPTGRVEAGEWPAMKVARTVYRGPYEGLPQAWPRFDAWIREQGHTAAQDLYEVYAAGPETSPDPKHWRTEFYRPLVG